MYSKNDVGIKEISQVMYLEAGLRVAAREQVQRLKSTIKPGCPRTEAQTEKLILIKPVIETLTRAEA